jgi:DNA-binding XRE family transcriptional regulator
VERVSSKRAGRDVKVTESELTPERRAKFEALRAKLRRPEALAEQEADRETYAALRGPDGRTKLSALVEVGEMTRAGADAVRGRIRLGRELAGLRAMRERRGLTLDQVAERSGIDQPALSRLETGKQPNPTLATIARYAEAIGMEVELTFRDKGTRPAG